MTTTKAQTQAATAASRLAALERGTDAATALAFFDGLPAVTLAEMTGAWRGRGLPTGHPLDGLLERFGWRGKRFDGPDDVHPLLFERGDVVVDVHPAFVPLALVARAPRLFASGLTARVFRMIAPALRTREPRARLRMLEHRGVVSATMIYDDLPVRDTFRRVDDDTRLGVMELRGQPPLLFVLRRER